MHCLGFTWSKTISMALLALSQSLGLRYGATVRSDKTKRWKRRETLLSKLNGAILLNHALLFDNPNIYHWLILSVTLEKFCLMTCVAQGVCAYCGRTLSFISIVGDIVDLEIYQVDSFTSQAFKGNPAGVCISQHVLDEALMLYCGWDGGSRNGFLALVNLWLCVHAEVEVQLCGHGTLATVHGDERKRTSKSQWQDRISGPWYLVI